MILKIYPRELNFNNMKQIVLVIFALIAFTNATLTHDSIKEQLNQLPIEQLRELALEAQKLLNDTEHFLNELPLKDLIKYVKKNELVEYISEQIAKNPYLVNGAPMTKPSHNSNHSSHRRFSNEGQRGLK